LANPTLGHQNRKICYTYNISYKQTGLQCEKHVYYFDQLTTGYHIALSLADSDISNLLTKNSMHFKNYSWVECTNKE